MSPVHAVHVPDHDHLPVHFLAPLYAPTHAPSPVSASRKLAKVVLGGLTRLYRKLGTLNCLSRHRRPLILRSMSFGPAPQQGLSKTASLLTLRSFAVEDPAESSIDLTAADNIDITTVENIELAQPIIEDKAPLATLQQPLEDEEGSEWERFFVPELFNEQEESEWERFFEPALFEEAGCCIPSEPSPIGQEQSLTKRKTHLSLLKEQHALASSTDALAYAPRMGERGYVTFMVALWSSHGLIGAMVYGTI